ncbi:TPA: fimbrial protein [Salmonella enterica subsp. enterica serovar Mississippi]|nr:fimbrial protein [Salmonella enterica subsp. enterica]ECW0788951.1 fimbrial protein [Salmonella enterica subsp. enterica]HED0168012.1 fimbrial protein [Salmonella enterica subsp. enterica serovar Mississippi]HED0173876.1 fimbrial protein [Salmonella enterica subsp. enterica serovar Mississippi]HED0195871.1 fimbrial protein [Salmonella enterica subsp. enterica serovar Mississippi]
MPGSVKLLLALMGGSFIFGIQPVRADNVNVKITGEIYIPPCKINGNDAEIQVSFDKMSLYEVDGYKNAKTKTVTVSCDYSQGTPYIRMDGAVLSGAGDNVLNTSGANASVLGIALYQGNDVNNSYPLKIGAGEQGKYGYKITRGLTGQNATAGQFTFTAVPYKHGAGTLNAGTFSATATMSISYL